MEKLRQHFLRHLVIRSDPALHRTDRDHIARGSAQHIPGGCADLQHLAGILVHRNHGGLPEHDPLPFCIDDHIGSSQVNPQVLG